MAMTDEQAGLFLARLRMGDRRRYARRDLTGARRALKVSGVTMAVAMLYR